MAIELGSTDFWERLKTDPARLASEVCMVDVVTLDNTLQLHASLRAWVNASHEAARIQEERLKWEETKIRARAFMDSKAVADAITGKPKTVDALKADVDLNPIVQEAREALLDQQETRGAFRAMADALEDRLQMLIQISAKQRKEMKDYAN